MRKSVWWHLKKPYKLLGPPIQHPRADSRQTGTTREKEICSPQRLTRHYASACLRTLLSVLGREPPFESTQSNTSSVDPIKLYSRQKDTPTRQEWACVRLHGCLGGQRLALLLPTKHNHALLLDQSIAFASACNRSPPRKESAPKCARAERAVAFYASL